MLVPRGLPGVLRTPKNGANVSLDEKKLAFSWRWLSRASTSSSLRELGSLVRNQHYTGKAVTFSIPPRD